MSQRGFAGTGVAEDGDGHGGLSDTYGLFIVGVLACLPSHIGEISSYK